ncbi:MAG: hypothetical protein ABEJ76_03690 [Halanaeroarchaeum sp.]
MAGLHEADIDVVSYLPDSVTWSLIDSVEHDETLDTVLVHREEEAVNLLSGAWLGGQQGALICQTSGLANTFNALGSASEPWGLPFVGIVSRRGDLGEHNRAQIAAGYNMHELLDTIGVRNTIVGDGDDAQEMVKLAAETAFSTETPYVLLLDETFTGGK